MSWNDGVSKALSDYFESLASLGDLAIEALKEQVKAEADKVLEQLQQTTPRGKTGDLLRSLKKAEITVRKDWYGYAISFDGEDKYGNSYQKIANVLNFGSSTIKPLRFISKIIKNLKGMDERIAAKIHLKVDKFYV